jgi:HSP20 family protein
MAKPKALGDTELVVSEVVVQTFGFYPAEESWTPAMNAYETEDAVELFFDLADVPRESIEVTAEPGRLIIRGQRVPPQPRCQPGQTFRILAMEIDWGPFKRIVALPRRVRLDAIESRYERGILWVRLPLRIA